MHRPTNSNRCDHTRKQLCQQKCSDQQLRLCSSSCSVKSSGLLLIILIPFATPTRRTQDGRFLQTSD
jgi:hypothetical protein